MKMKYHKISKIPLTVCTAEQKIAYNIAFRLHITYQEKFNMIKTASPFNVPSIIRELIERGLKEYQNSFDYKPDQYNLDAIFSALHAGLEKYLTSPFIAKDFEQIGKAFPAHYL